MHQQGAADRQGNVARGGRTSRTFKALEYAQGTLFVEPFAQGKAIQPGRPGKGLCEDGEPGQGHEDVLSLQGAVECSSECSSECYSKIASKCSSECRW